MLRYGALTLIGVGAAGFIALPYKHFLSTYAWHIKQPEFVEGGIELLCLFCCLCLLVSLIRNSRLASGIAIAAAALYLQVHSILIPAAAALFYLEILLQIGGAIERRLGMDSSGGNLTSGLTRFITGTAAWTVGALALSALGFGTFNQLRGYTLVLLGVAWVCGASTPLTLTLIRRFGEASARDRIAAIFLLMILLMQFGKINFSCDFDTKWYGMRPERVLIGDRSVFDDLKLVHYVYYYPKQFELLAIPLSNLKYAFIPSINVILLAIGFLAIYRLGRELDLERTEALFVTALAASIPVVSNMASTAKTDVLTGTFAFIGSLFFWRWCKGRSRGDFAYAIAASLGMLGTKITSFAFTPMLVIGYVCVGMAMLASDRGGSSGKGRPLGFLLCAHEKGMKAAPLMLVATAIFAYGGLALRTWVFTGIPTFPAFVETWKKLGGTLKYPYHMVILDVRSVRIQGIGDFLTHWYRLLFDPSPYSHYVMAWPGNIGFFALFVLLLLVAFRTVRGANRFRFLCANLPIMIAGVVAASTIRPYPDGGTDGNYYIVPVVLTLLSASAVLAHTQRGTRRMLTACGICFIAVHMPIMMVSHWSWSYGTQPFRFSLAKSFVDTNKIAETRLKKAGAWEIQEYLQNHASIGLCVGYGNPDLRFLACRHEDFEQLGGPFGALFASQAAFRQYLTWASPGLLIMPKSFLLPPSAGAESVRRVFHDLAQRPETIKIEAQDYIALDISATLRAAAVESR